MILVVGQSGQVATELGRYLPDALFLDSAACDLSKPTECIDAILHVRPRAVINAAGYSDLNGAEENEALSILMNAEAPAAMARTCEELKIPFVHLSSDQVFSGTGVAPHLPSDPAQPVNTLGRSKLLGEQGIHASACVHAIVRTSWIFASHGDDFLKDMLQIGKTRTMVNVVSDQIAGPTPARDLAYALMAMTEALIVDPTRTGTYHFAGAPDVSRSGFAKEIFRQTGQDVIVNEIPASQFPMRARLPLNCRLDCLNLRTFTLQRPDWRAGLTTALQELDALPSEQ
ncbi:NAD(P)-dependent oxidoreductase [Donghicola sp. XS_ASV15]|uniref:SDR family oxidoreductase n=1 Tax=Donghicola sp. XS_ASV15 TaxID=3241295 RepID=UPI0035148D89